MQHGFCRFTVSLVIDGHSPVGFYPRKRPFYDPSEGKCHKLESRFFGGEVPLQNPIQVPWQTLPTGFDSHHWQRAFKAGKSVCKLLYNRYYAFKIMDVCWMNRRCHKKSKYICDDMFFSTFSINSFTRWEVRHFESLWYQDSEIFCHRIFEPNLLADTSALKRLLLVSIF